MTSKRMFLSINREMCQRGMEGFEPGTLVDPIYMYMCSNTVNLHDNKRRFHEKKNVTVKLL